VTYEFKGKFIGKLIGNPELGSAQPSLFAVCFVPFRIFFFIFFIICPLIMAIKMYFLSETYLLF
jgi:hypothetical protein